MGKRKSNQKHAQDCFIALVLALKRGKGHFLRLGR
jgi:hypothetical protein